MRLIIIILLATMFLTNPTEQDYQSWAKEQIVAQSDNLLEKGIFSLVSDNLINKTSISKDYYIFSIHKTYYDDKEFKTIGVFDRFIPLTETPNWKS